MLFGLGASGSAAAACKLARLAELPVTMVDRKPMVTAKINGVDARFAVDSGAFFSVITPANAAEYQLKLHAAPAWIRVTGIGGETQVSMTQVKVFTLAGIPFPEVEFLVGGGRQRCRSDRSERAALGRRGIRPRAWGDPSDAGR
jgi:hypothetical protein